MLKTREAEHQRRLDDQAEELRKEAANRREAEEARHVPWVSWVSWVSFFVFWAVICRHMPSFFFPPTLLGVWQDVA